MNLGVAQSTWIEANQRLLIAELARLKLRLGAEGDVEVACSSLAEARSAMPAPSAIDVLANTFGLSPFERDVLLLCAGVEMDAGLARLCAEAQGNAQRIHASFGLALAALEDLVDELGDDHRPVDRIGHQLSARGGTLAGHVSSPSWRRSDYGPACGRARPRCRACRG